jgi:hypothetical protein
VLLYRQRLLEQCLQVQVVLAWVAVLAQQGQQVVPVWVADPVPQEQFVLAQQAQYLQERLCLLVLVHHPGEFVQELGWWPQH